MTESIAETEDHPPLELREGDRRPGARLVWVLPEQPLTDEQQLLLTNARRDMIARDRANDEATAIVRDLAAQDAPIAHRGYDEHPECTHCDTYRPDGVQDHDPTCPWARAVAWVAANPVAP